MIAGLRIRPALAGLAAACCLMISGCAGPGGASLAAEGPGVIQPGNVSAPAAQAGIVMGKSTKADVAAALGPARVVSFDSGFEVWVYRWPGAERTIRSATELVILFEPSGIVRKTRIRPGYGPEPK